MANTGSEGRTMYVRAAEPGTSSHDNDHFPSLQPLPYIDQNHYLTVTYINQCGHSNHTVTSRFEHTI